MTDPFAMRSYCAFRPLRQGPNYLFNNSTDDNAPSVSQYPSLAFANRDHVNLFAPSTEGEYTIHKSMENPHEQKVQLEDQEKVIKASASPIKTLQKGMGQVETTILNAFEHPVMKTSKITVGAGAGKKSSNSKPKGSKIKFV